MFFPAALMDIHGISRLRIYWGRAIPASVASALVVVALALRPTMRW